MLQNDGSYANIRINVFGCVFLVAKISRCSVYAAIRRSFIKCLLFAIALQTITSIKAKHCSRHKNKILNDLQNKVPCVIKCHVFIGAFVEYT